MKTIYENVIDETTFLKGKNALLFENKKYKLYKQLYNGRLSLFLWDGKLLVEIWETNPENYAFMLEEASKELKLHNGDLFKDKNN